MLIKELDFIGLETTTDLTTVKNTIDNLCITLADYDKFMKDVVDNKDKETG